MLVWKCIVLLHWAPMSKENELSGCSSPQKAEPPQRVLVLWRAVMHREEKAEGTSTATADGDLREETKGTSEQPPIPAGSQVKN